MIYSLLQSCATLRKSMDQRKPHVESTVTHQRQSSHVHKERVTMVVGRSSSLGTTTMVPVAETWTRETYWLHLRKWLKTRFLPSRPLSGTGLLMSARVLNRALARPSGLWIVGSVAEEILQRKLSTGLGTSKTIVASLELNLEKTFLVKVSLYLSIWNSQGWQYKNKRPQRIKVPY